ncbi:hypothetical protein COS53_00480 [Candidatus Shapirobacteria bacterium CG03_land_8_20_14_0_80_35_14]|uniref:Endonuclease/exonuclease/phosphatase domain-containing protein n=1 Tax=Candidatus Shapirobacteria bacterium CG03_land_8_20_14_0_80_35_14 TaxID=1974878 RepID=A0A2M7BQP1_9BACT|nr:MAG: hypothetical protein COS53_00480 [Candidatus Shapirobacteria bacterium CG03_land_8_20_14_0_80_35_14]
MRVLFLNVWRGELGEETKKYIVDESRNTDVFCLQEYHGDFRHKCDGKLNKFQSVFSEKHLCDKKKFALANYLDNNLEIVCSGSIIGEKIGLGLGIYTKIKVNNETITIGNIHGIPKPGHKLDTKERIYQSKGIIKFFNKINGRKIIGGDFNVLPNTESVEMFEKNGYVDLIKKYKIKTTRNELAWKPYPNNKKLFSDYVFVSPEVKVKSFKVPNIKVSDHLPMILEIEI